MRLGRFESQTQMKAAQETILEMSKNHQVIRDALTQVGPISSGWSIASLFGTSKKYPSDELVAEFAKYNVSVHAPKGVEFGATEVIYLDIKANSPSLASKLSKSVSAALDARLREVREKRATSIISELEGQNQLLDENSSQSPKRLRSWRLVSEHSFLICVTLPNRLEQGLRVRRSIKS